MRRIKLKKHLLPGMRVLGRGLLLLLVFLPLAAADSMPGADGGAEQPASNWRLKGGAPAVAYQCDVSIESDYPDTAEAVIYSNAVELGIVTDEDGRNNSKNVFPSSLKISFNTTPEKAKKLCGKLKEIGILRKHSAHTLVSEKTLADLRRKAELISGELTGNKDKLGKLPNARALLLELLSQYKKHIAACEAVAGKGNVSVNLAPTKEE